MPKLERNRLSRAKKTNHILSYIPFTLSKQPASTRLFTAPSHHTFIIVMGKKKRHVHSCDLDCYNFNYESIYNEKEYKECFWEYLRCTHNEGRLKRKGDDTNDLKQHDTISFFVT